MNFSLKKDYHFLIVKCWLQLFLVAIFISFLYALLVGEYNGDFYGSIVEIGYEFLILNFIFSLLPFWILWNLYLKIKKKERVILVISWIKPLVWFTLLMIILNIGLTLIYGVGVAGSPIYMAPDVLKPIIQILIRFNVFLAAFILMLNLPKRSPFDFVFTILLITLSLSRASIGIFLFLPMLFMFKYGSELINFYRKKRIQCLAIIFILSLSSISLLDLRANIRGADLEGLSYSEVLFARVAGRISSYSNSAVIIENASFFALSAQDLDDTFMQKQLLAGIFSGSFLPDILPEKMLFELNNSSEINASFMLGVNGILYFSLFKSPYIFILNFLTYLVSIIIILKLGRSINLRHSLDVAFLYLLYIIASGVASEFGVLIISLFFLKGITIFIKWLPFIIRFIKY